MLATTRLGLSVTRPSVFSAHAATRSFFKTIPQPPGHIVGTVNDAYVPPPPSKLHGSAHWTFERAVTIGLLPLVAAPFVTGTSPLDSAMCGLLLYHCYAGLQSCIIDYIPKRVYGGMHSAAMAVLAFGTFVAGYGVYKVENEEKDGVFGLLKKLWSV